MNTGQLARAFTAVVLMTIPGLATAADITIGTKLIPSSIDPHYFNATENENASGPIFETLISITADGEPEPTLALEWGNTDELTWVFKLRPDVTFQDGSPLTVEDIRFSIDRIKSITGTPGGFNAYVNSISEVIDNGDGSITIKTDAPTPLLPYNMSRVWIVQKAAAEGKDAAAFNSPDVAIGTGPYALTEYSPGTGAEYTGYDGYWGGEPAWDNVSVKYIANDAARMAALLAGDLDMADSVPTSDIKRLNSEDGLVVGERPGTRIQYFGLDVDRDDSPYAKGPNGENPLKDVRVRKALSMAIDRKALVEYALEGSGTPTNEMLNPEIIGQQRPAEVGTYDPEAAKALLAEAGYAHGFELTIHSGNDRYPGADRIMQATAQMFSRIGVKVKVELFPNNVFFPKATAREFSFYFLGYGTVDGSNYIRTLMHTKSPDIGLGTSNRGGYSNPKVDEMVKASLATFDTAERQKLFGDIMRIVTDEDYSYMPLYYPAYVWAWKSDVLEYKTNLAGVTQPNFAVPK